MKYELLILNYSQPRYIYIIFIYNIAMKSIWFNDVMIIIFVWFGRVMAQWFKYLPDAQLDY